MNTKLYVGNLSYDTDEAALREAFGKAGTVRSVSIPTDRTTGQPRGFAFVEMETANDALKAIRLCNGQEINGREIRVNEARPPEQRDGGGRGGDRGGDRGSRGGSGGRRSY